MGSNMDPSLPVTTPELHEPLPLFFPEFTTHGVSVQERLGQSQSYTGPSPSDYGHDSQREYVNLQEIEMNPPLLSGEVPSHYAMDMTGFSMFAEEEIHLYGPPDANGSQTEVVLLPLAAP
jgi:hypothetical protein